ncbi:helix-turn-helix domain-containing protein [Pseudomonas sp. MSSRFD41]|uniref:transcriptional regulator n=1 Tax=Pseudomonas sp. MSSRFD41 TaxID=1310370 RepID=UPI00163B0766|nr:YdaS family helix-turn-helix protein [Pseudomonas sp. MSSRFD41]MBC2655065.1 helix-turn-helix domain-containing protein [Pseudomonas sp. MSSRFD41]
MSIFNELASFFGGQVATAAALGVTQGTVSGWIRGVHGCSAEVAFLAERITDGKFLASQLRPSLANPAPTLTETVRPVPPAHQSADGAVQTSSTKQAFP